jgi:hypothetical protein
MLSAGTGFGPAGAASCTLHSLLIDCMKTLATFVIALALPAGLLEAQAQTPATPSKQPSAAQPANSPKQAAPRATPYKGPHVVNDTKALGQKMIKESKPADSTIPMRVRPK